MNQDSFSTPIAFFIFNRPDLTSIVFQAIRQAKPPQLFIIADGPRNEKDKEKCEKAKAIVSQIDWDCKIFQNYADTNMGCKLRVSSGIDWVFNQVEQAIILEDDCLPHPTFFMYCQNMLNRFQLNENIMHIAGVNFQNGKKRGEASYYFSKYPHVWGWATWRRAWKKYDVNIANYPTEIHATTFKQWCSFKGEYQFWNELLLGFYQKKIDSWDYQWLFTCSTHNALCVMPNVNLVSNIGFRADATHTFSEADICSNLPTQPYPFSDKIADIKANVQADRHSYFTLFNPKKSTTPIYSITRKIYKYIPLKFKKIKTYFLKPS